MDKHRLTTGQYVDLYEDILGDYIKFSNYVDPNGIDPTNLSQFDYKFPEKIEYEAFLQMVSFFLHYADKKLEVQARIYSRYYASEEQKQDGRQDYIVVVPKQSIAPSSVTYDYKFGVIMDLDGTQYSSLDELEDLGYKLMVHFHLHPFNMPMPSGTDDGNEIPHPCMYGIISLPTTNRDSYEIVLSVVRNNGIKNCRYSIKESWKVIDLPEDSNIQKVIELIRYSEEAHNQIIPLEVLVPLPPKAHSFPAPQKFYTYVEHGTIAKKSKNPKLEAELNKLITKYGYLTVDDCLSNLSFKNNFDSYLKSANEYEILY